MRNKKFFLFCISASIISCAISVSISQFFLLFGFFAFLLDKKRRILPLNPILISGLCLFGWYFLSIIYHTITLGFTDGLGRMQKSEFKDIFLISAFILTYSLKKRERKRIINALQILILMLLLTGFISIFSNVRLAVLFNEFFRTINTWRFTQHYGDVLGIGIYVPIGLMNTHLTFGGLLFLFYPYLIYNFIYKWKMKGFVHSIPAGIFLSAYSLTFLLNNARSAMVGAFVGIIFGIIDTVWNRQIFSLVRFLRLSAILLSILIGLGSILYLNETTSKTIKPLLGSSKHTDSGRTFIWDSSFPLIYENPIFGAGPGRYDAKIAVSRKEGSIENKELSFFYEVSQTGHAHNDYFHFASVAGLPAAIFYILILFFISIQIFSKKIHYPFVAIFYGLIGFFFAGLFQCYFQDDEVVIVFWFLAGLLAGFAKDKENVAI